MAFGANGEQDTARELGATRNVVRLLLVRQVRSLIHILHAQSVRTRTYRRLDVNETNLPCAHHLVNRSRDDSRLPVPVGLAAASSWVCDEGSSRRCAIFEYIFIRDVHSRSLRSIPCVKEPESLFLSGSSLTTSPSSPEPSAVPSDICTAGHGNGGASKDEVGVPWTVQPGAGLRAG